MIRIRTSIDPGNECRAEPRSEIRKPPSCFARGYSDGLPQIGPLPQGRPSSRPEPPREYFDEDAIARRDKGGEPFDLFTGIISFFMPGGKIVKKVGRTILKLLVEATKRQGPDPKEVMKAAQDLHDFKRESPGFRAREGAAIDRMEKREREEKIRGRETMLS